MAYDEFRHIQLSQHEDMLSFKAAKDELRDRLRSLTDLLDHQLSSAFGCVHFNTWYTSYQPFHWVAEFYQIIHGNGGFDVIIGNPPYVEYTKVGYSLKEYKTLKCSNLYTCVIERCFKLSSKTTRVGMIVPISSICTNRMIEYQKILLEKNIWNSLYAERPSKLFAGAEVQLVISLICDNTQGQSIHSSKYNKWNTEYREYLFQNICYESVHNIIREGSLPKIGSNIEKTIIHKILKDRNTISNYQIKLSDHYVSYRNAGGRYYKVVLNYEPIFKLNGIIKKSSTYQRLYFDDKKYANSICCIMNSSLFFWYWLNYSDTWHLVNREIGSFPINLEEAIIEELNIINTLLMADFLKKSINKIENRNKGKDSVEFTQYNARESKSIIDKIDKILAQHYGFTEEELDFIINYDIKYRMGDEVNHNEDN